MRTLLIVRSPCTATCGNAVPSRASQRCSSLRRYVPPPWILGSSRAAGARIHCSSRSCSSAPSRAVIVCQASSHCTSASRISGSRRGVRARSRAAFAPLTGVSRRTRRLPRLVASARGMAAPAVAAEAAWRSRCEASCSGDELSTGSLATADGVFDDGEKRCRATPPARPRGLRRRTAVPVGAPVNSQSKSERLSARRSATPIGLPSAASVRSVRAAEQEREELAVPFLQRHELPQRIAQRLPSHRHDRPASGHVRDMQERFPSSQTTRGKEPPQPSARARRCQDVHDPVCFERGGRRPSGAGQPRPVVRFAPRRRDDDELVLVDRGGLRFRRPKSRRAGAPEHE